MMHNFHAWEILLPNRIWYRTEYLYGGSKGGILAEDGEDEELAYLD
jgi:hypothetical protein